MDRKKADYELWQSNWKLVESKFRPFTDTEALQWCESIMYPNMYEFFSTVTAERSLSTLRYW